MDIQPPEVRSEPDFCVLARHAPISYKFIDIFSSGIPLLGGDHILRRLHARNGPPSRLLAGARMRQGSAVVEEGCNVAVSECDALRIGSWRDR